MAKHDCVIRDLSKVTEGKKLYNMKAYGQIIPGLTLRGAISIVEDEEVGTATVRGDKIFVDGKQIAVLEAI